jgi:hypothetical protein
MENGRDPLIPPIAEIHDRLAKNERERRRLRTLLKLAVDDRDSRNGLNLGIFPAGRPSDAEARAHE